MNTTSSAMQSSHDRMQGHWKPLSGGVHHQWGKLTHHDVEQIKGDVEMLEGKIEERYGVTKAEARKQIEHWVATKLARQLEQSHSKTKEH
jgi:uncharacterized protein YjbJ (UPF0337 family)